MVDTLTPLQRSERMSRVRATNTKPEMAVRRLVHALGYRYRLHATDLPGRPDLVFRPKRRVIFVSGCFWHRHPRCPNCRVPKSRLAFWEPKLDENRQRDLRNQRLLRRLGWKYLIIWECQLRDLAKVSVRIQWFLEQP